jgi:hypothetical protein
LGRQIADDRLRGGQCNGIHFEAHAYLY